MRIKDADQLSMEQKTIHKLYTYREKGVNTR